MNQLETFTSVETFIFDVDGVFTNNEVLLLEDGKVLRKMNMRDGLAVKMAIAQGFRIAIISGGKSEGLKLRFRDLGITDIHLGVEDKLEVFDELIDTYDLDPGKVLYMGDDLTDYPVLRRVGLPSCPSNAVSEVMDIAQYVSPFVGGAGCVRDVIEKAMRLQGKWQ